MIDGELAILYFVFAAASAFAFRLFGARRAVIGCYLGGWILLPAGIYPPSGIATGLPIDIMPLAVPSRMLTSKAAAIPLIIGVITMAGDLRRWKAFRPRPIDAVVAAFCLWPLAQSLVIASDPAGWRQSAYLLAAWGGSWLIGRLYVSGPDGRNDLVKALMWSGAALLPVAFVEGLAGPRFYELLYGPHPFAGDGAERYLGFRPLAFFENGNQYGLWIALSALAGVIVAKVAPAYRLLAALLIAAALAAQSVGAILLLAVGVLVLRFRTAISRRMILTGATVIAGCVLLLGVILLVGGKPVVDFGIHAFRAVGRGSFPWRVSQDLKMLSLIAEHPLAGFGEWDWWRPKSTRPWDLPTLLVGQFGLIGLLLALPFAAIPVYRIAKNDRDAFDNSIFAAALIAVLALLDALLNAFIFFPALLLAGGLAIPDRQPASDRSASDGG